MGLDIHGKLFRAAGGEADTAAAPATITLEWLQRECEQLERVLRIQRDDGQLDPEDEDAIAEYKPVTDTTRGLRLWAYLKHLYLSDPEGLGRPGATREQDRLVASHELRDREPVRIRIATRDVDVTARSRAAEIGMYRHELTRRMIRSDLERAAELYAAIETALPEQWRARGALRRRMRRIELVHRELHQEIAYQTRWILAHALTPTGAPAHSEHDAPGWWSEVTRDDEQELLRALFAAGVGRYARLGPAPRREGRGRDRGQVEEFGFDSLLASVERALKLPPARLQNEDRWRLLAWLRNGAPPVEEAFGE